MSGAARQYGYPSMGPLVFRVALFAAAATLALYIPFKYATQLNAITGLYAFLFPLSGILALTGMLLALKPRVGCSCGDLDTQTSVMVRSGVGAIAVLWMLNGALCIPTLTAMFEHSAWGATFAVAHMAIQHVFLSSAILLFAFAPFWMARKLGVDLDVATAPAKVSVRNQSA